MLSPINSANGPLVFHKSATVLCPANKPLSTSCGQIMPWYAWNKRRGWAYIPNYSVPIRIGVSFRPKMKHNAVTSVCSIPGRTTRRLMHKWLRTASSKSTLSFKCTVIRQWIVEYTHVKDCIRYTNTGLKNAFKYRAANLLCEFVLKISQIFLIIFSKAPKRYGVLKIAAPILL